MKDLVSVLVYANEDIPDERIADKFSGASLDCCLIRHVSPVVGLRPSESYSSPASTASRKGICVRSIGLYYRI
jgi:hypothetical protein